jgi:hypothetical protein
MVNNPNPRLGPTLICPKPLTTQNKSLGHRRLYDLAVVKALIKIHSVVLINDDAQEDAEKQLNMSPQEVGRFIEQLSPDNYVNSQWCKTSVNKTVDCDSYTMRYNINKQQPWDRGRSIYVKFGFLPNLPKCVVCSVHEG